MDVQNREVRDITAEEYHATLDVSSGGVRAFATEGAWSYHAKYVAKSLVSPDSDARRMGRAFHLAMSDPDGWGDFFRVLPTTLQTGDCLDRTQAEWNERSKEPLAVGTKLNLRSPAHRFYRDLLIADAAENGYEFITEDELTPLLEMGRSISENPAVIELLESADTQFEVPTFATCSATGLGVKAMPDVQAASFLIDWKTTRQYTREGFLKDAFNFGYQYQAAWYLDVTGRDRFYIVSVRNKPPYESMVYLVPENEIEQARSTNRNTMEAIKLCFDFEDWHTQGWGSISDLTRDYRYSN